MLNVAVVEEWATDLERGRWKQGSSYLRPSADTYCCLGCLSEVVRPYIGGQWLEIDLDEGDDFAGKVFDYELGEYVDDEDYEPTISYEWLGVAPSADEGTWHRAMFRSQEELTEDVAEFVGIGVGGTFEIGTDEACQPICAPIVIDGVQYHSLADANDKGCTFPQIAGVLREWVALAEEAGLAA